MARQSASFPFTLVPLDLEDSAGNVNSMYNKLEQNFGMSTLQSNGLENVKDTWSFCSLI